MPSAAVEGARGVGAVRDRDVPRPTARHRPAARHAPCRSSVGREGLLRSLIPTPLRPKSTAPPAPSRRSVWGFGRRRGHPAPPDLKGVEKLMTTLMQAHRQWMSRAPDERFASLLEMQTFKRRVRENSRSHTISSRGLYVRPVEDDSRSLQILGNGYGLPAAAPTHWSFGQLCSLASPGNSPAGYFRETNMPARMIADCLNYNLRFTRGIEDIGVLLTSKEDGSVNELRSVNGPNYGRVYDADVVDALVNRFGDGVSGTWRVPGEFGNRVTVDKQNTTLYASDRDMFVFLADEENRIELPNRRAGRSGSFARGFFVWNSEVGKTTLGAGFFLFDYVCCNRIIWGADQYTEVRIRHTKG